MNFDSHYTRSQLFERNGSSLIKLETFAKKSAIPLWVGFILSYRRIDKKTIVDLVPPYLASYKVMCKGTSIDLEFFKFPLDILIHFCLLWYLLLGDIFFYCFQILRKNIFQLINLFLLPHFFWPNPNLNVSLFKTVLFIDLLSTVCFCW